MYLASLGRTCTYRKGYVGCSFWTGEVKILDNVIVGRFEETDVCFTERSPDVGFACGEPQTRHVDVRAEVVPHLCQGVSDGRNEV